MVYRVSSQKGAAAVGTKGVKPFTGYMPDVHEDDKQKSSLDYGYDDVESTDETVVSIMALKGFLGQWITKVTHAKSIPDPLRDEREFALQPSLPLTRTAQERAKFKLANKAYQSSSARQKPSASHVLQRQTSQLDGATLDEIQAVITDLTQLQRQGVRKLKLNPDAKFLDGVKAEIERHKSYLNTRRLF